MAHTVLDEDDRRPCYDPDTSETLIPFTTTACIAYTYAQACLVHIFIHNLVPSRRLLSIQTILNFVRDCQLAPLLGF